MFRGPTSRPHTGDLVMSLFYFGAQRSWLGMALKWSILDQKWPNMAGLSTFQSGPKGIKMANLSVFDHLEPFWTLLYHFKQKLFFCSRAPPPNPTLSIWWLQSFSVKVAVRSTTDVWSNLTVFFNVIYLVSRDDSVLFFDVSHSIWLICVLMVCRGWQTKGISDCTDIQGATLLDNDGHWLVAMCE